MSRRTVAVFAGLVIAGIAVAAILVTTLEQAPRQTETGVVIAVDARSLTDIRAFEIRTPDGRTVIFRIGQLENGAQFPPGHLTEHKATAVPVVVTYHDENGEKVAVRIEDAISVSPSAPPS